MGTGSRSILSAEVERLSETICKNSTQQHYTTPGNVLLVVVKEVNLILICDYRRSLRPLSRIEGSNGLVVLRTFFTLEETLTHLRWLERVVSNTGSFIKHGVCAEEFKGHDNKPVIQLNAEGKVSLGKRLTTSVAQRLTEKFRVGLTGSWRTLDK